MVKRKDDKYLWEELLMTQCEKIIQYMTIFGSISTMEAFSDLGITRLGSRIHDLRHDGYKIKGKSVKSTNRFGEPVRFMRYYLEED